MFCVYEDIIRERIKGRVFEEYGSATGLDDVEEHVDLAWACWENDVEKLRGEADRKGIVWFLEKGGKDWMGALKEVMLEFGVRLVDGAYEWESVRRTRWGAEDFESRKGMVHVSLGWFEKGGSASGSVNFCRSEKVTMRMTWMVFCEGRGIVFRLESEKYLRFRKIEMRTISDKMEMMPMTTNFSLRFDLEESRQDGVFVWKSNEIDDTNFFDRDTQKTICVYYVY